LKSRNHPIAKSRNSYGCASGGSCISFFMKAINFQMLVAALALAALSFGCGGQIAPNQRPGDATASRTSGNSAQQQTQGGNADQTTSSTKSGGGNAQGPNASNTTSSSKGNQTTASGGQSGNATKSSTSGTGGPH
jgi:hypothetical protein